jgi:hypothetical protein
MHPSARPCNHFRAKALIVRNQSVRTMEGRMSSNTKWVVGVIVVIVVVAVLYFAFRAPTTEMAPATGGATTETPAPAPAEGGTTGTTGGATTSP